MSLKHHQTSALKALLKDNRNNPRIYASIYAVWSHQTPAWTWTNGFSAIGSGEIGKDPESLITLKDLELKALDGFGSPFEPHHNARRTSVKYPNVSLALKPTEILASAKVDVRTLLQTVKALKGLGHPKKPEVTVEIRENFLWLKTDEHYAVLCEIAGTEK